MQIAKGPLVLDVVAAIKRLRLERIGYEPARMTCDVFESLKSRLPMKRLARAGERLGRSSCAW